MKSNIPNSHISDLAGALSSSCTTGHQLHVKNMLNY